MPPTNELQWLRQKINQTIYVPTFFIDIMRQHYLKTLNRIRYIIVIKISFDHVYEMDTFEYSSCSRQKNGIWNIVSCVVWKLSAIIKVEACCSKLCRRSFFRYDSIMHACSLHRYQTSKLKTYFNHLSLYMYQKLIYF